MELECYITVHSSDVHVWSTDQVMFLSSFQDSNSFSFGLSGGVSARKAAIEAELRHMANFSGNDIEVEAEGGCIILTGSVDSSVDFYRALNVATDIAGANKVIFRVGQM